MRLRSAIYPNKIRYYAVGEYGDETQRPHYHVALFGLDGMSTDLIEEKWKKGHVYVGDLSRESAQYICGYILKKMTKSDPRLNGRVRERALMSRKPGIGAAAMNIVASTMASEAGSAVILQEGDMPASLRHGKQLLPLGRYLRMKLREAYGFKNTGAQEGWDKKRVLQKLQEFDAFIEKGEDSLDYWRYVEETRKQKILNIEGKSRICRKGKL